MTTTLAKAIEGWLVYELQRTGFRWEPSVARYRNLATGRFVSEKAILMTAEGYADYAKSNMAKVTQRYIDGKIDVRAWQAAMRTEIKDAHMINAMAGRGGRNAMTQADFGRVGARLRVQYGHLDGMAWEYANGQISDAQLQARVQMYGSKTRTSYYDGKTAAGKAGQLTQERRRLNPAEHCADCLGYAALGWVPIGTLPEPGEQSVCRANCKCTKEYRAEPEEDNDEAN